MPTEKTSRRDVINAIKQLPSLAPLLAERAGHYEYELDLEVVIYGRNYNGKKVGPYVRLLDYQADEIIVTEGEWGGNAFHIVVAGQAEVVVGQGKVAELKPGTTFGQMSLLAGVPRNATVKAPTGAGVQVLEIQRPALRLLRKLPKFGEELDEAYRKHGRDAMLEEFKARFNLPADLIAELKAATRFRTFAKNHQLTRTGGSIARLYFIKHGWLQRTLVTPTGESLDFLGGGYCFGLEALRENATWPYSIKLLGRTEVFEISTVKLRQQGPGLQRLNEALAQLAPPGLTPPMPLPTPTALPVIQRKTQAAQQELIETGLVDGTNLLVMDMDLCVRCGNCSLACHRTHGQARLVRRGIHITRLTRPSLRAQQSLLSPEVCMHCKDPECLTGCPTGAIERLRGGQIDINQASCIGCGDCATQCPYDAISMIPRGQSAKSAKAAKESAAPSNAKWKLPHWLSLAPKTLPPAVETLDDLVAVKCNLCSDRVTLNPPGARTHKYSCEENCPTGALARVNPREYFSEIKGIEGPRLQMVSQQRALGRNIHVADWPKRVMHVVGLTLTLASTVATWYGIQRYQLGGPVLAGMPGLGFLNMRWLTGLGGLFGIVGVMLYPYRRVLYARRVGALRYWMLSHTYLGVIAAVLLLLHGGSHAGGWLTWALMIAFDLVILTGLFGIACYWIAPRLLTRIEEVPLLLDDLLKRRSELRHEWQTLQESELPAVAASLSKSIQPRFQSLSFLLRQYLRRQPLNEAIEEAKLGLVEAAKKAGARTLQARLGENEALSRLARQALRSPQEEATLLLTLRSVAERNLCQQAIQEVRRALQQIDEAIVAAVTLRRVDALIYLHRALKLWLPPHVITTALMLALLVVHLIQVIYFMAR